MQRGARKEMLPGLYDIYDEGVTLGAESTPEETRQLNLQVFTSDNPPAAGRG